MCSDKSKKEVNYHFGRKVNQDVSWNKKLFSKEEKKVNGGKMEQNKKYYLEDEDQRG